MCDYKGNRDIAISRPTTSLTEAVKGAQVIIIPLPAIADENFARELAPYLTAGQVVYLPPEHLVLTYSHRQCIVLATPRMSVFPYWASSNLLTGGGDILSYASQHLSPTIDSRFFASETAELNMRNN